MCVIYFILKSSLFYLCVCVCMCVNIWAAAIIKHWKWMMLKIADNIEQCCTFFAFTVVTTLSVHTVCFVMTRCGCGALVHIWKKSANLRRFFSTRWLQVFNDPFSASYNAVILILPLQVTPSPLNPVLHSQVKLPSVSVQLALLSQLWLGWDSPSCAWHSLMLLQLCPSPE